MPLFNSLERIAFYLDLTLEHDGEVFTLTNSETGELVYAVGTLNDVAECLADTVKDFRLSF